MMNRIHVLALTLVLASALAGCVKQAPVTTPAPAPPPPPVVSAPRTAPAQPVRDTPPAPPIIPAEPTVTAGDPLVTAAIEAINKDSPLKPVFFAYDSDALDEAARKTMADNAEVLKRYSTWTITIEGHCDERGTAEYNLALGDRRALAAKNYLASLGIPANRISTVSYGNEFPFDPGHDEKAWFVNRRAHFMLTAK